MSKDINQKADETSEAIELVKLDDIGEVIEFDCYSDRRDIFLNLMENLGLNDDDDFFPSDLTEDESTEFLFHGHNQVMHEKINALSIKVDFPKNVSRVNIISNPFYHFLFNLQKTIHTESGEATEKGIHKYFLVKLDPEKYDSRFFSLLAETPNYRRRWKHKIFNKEQQTIDINFIKKMDFFCPSIEIQKNIVSNILNLKKVNKQLEKYLQTASLNPFESIKDTMKIEEIARVVGSLPKPDLIKALIESGENDKVEFKSSFSHCIKNKTKEKYIIEEIIKTIAGFLNRDGGDLLVGVSDNGEIYGVEEET